MSRYFVQLSYLGTRYHGWQHQANSLTVQDVLDGALSQLLKAPISTIGAGRTDSGVHARRFVAHFDSPATDLHTSQKIIYSLNHILPQDIVVEQITPVVADAHARFSATSRTYEYLISQQKNPFRLQQCWFYNTALNMDQMQAAARILLTYNDFTSFSKLGSDNRTNRCKIYEAQWRENDNLLIFRIKADRFLRNMVRAIVGTLVDVGRGRLSPSNFEAIIQAQDRSRAGTSAPAQGLFLTDVEYPNNIFC